MRIVIQRVKNCSVTIDNRPHSNIGKGLLVLLGIEQDDQNEDMDWLINKLIQMRIFSDEDGKMNLSVQDIQGSIMVVSQFTLHASTKKGNRPSFLKAARPDKAIPLYESFIQKLETLIDNKIASGIFGADMQVTLLNDGPVTIIIDSKNKE